MARYRRPPSLNRLLRWTRARRKPVAFVLAGHNGSGKSTLWYERLVPRLRIPLINADRLTLSILPELDDHGRLPEWAQKLRDGDIRWQLLAQESVTAFVSLVTEKRMSFAFETVFSHWKKRPDGSIESKADMILELQAKGYVVILLFVGLATVDLSIMRVRTRRARGGHDVPIERLIARFPRTQVAVGHAAHLADMTIMFDNSRGPAGAFALARAQRGQQVLFDCRDPVYTIEGSSRRASTLWLEKVVGAFDRDRLVAPASRQATRPKSSR